jgi:hypothetical protein
VAIQKSPDELPEERRQAIYRAIVEAEDLQELTPEQARHLIARRFGISESQAKHIAREGRERLWPTA